MRAVAEGCGEKVNVAAFAQLESFPEFCNCGREISDGQITLADAFQHPLHVLLRKAARVLNNEGSTGKILDEMGRNEQVAKGMQLLDVIVLAQCILNTSLQDGGVRFI